VSILLNSGSTHKFIDPRMVHRTGLQVTPEPSFNVTIAGNDKLQSGGCTYYMINCRVGAG